MTRIRSWVALLFGLALALSGFADPIAEATYARLFDRAQGLMPGVSTVEQDPAQTGAWEIVGGRQLKEAGGIAVEAQAQTVEVSWKGAFPRAVPSLALTFSVETAEPVRVRLFGFYADRFNRLNDWMPVAPGAKKPLVFSVKGEAFGGFKLAIEGQNLPGKTIQLKDLKLSADFHEGFFRREVTIPAGEIWEAVAEVGNLTTLTVNGQRVDDVSAILPRPIYRGADLYQSKRVTLRPHLKPGRNVLGLYSPRFAYLRGSVIMATGERLVLDSGTNWVWCRAAPANWPAPDYDASAWQPVRPKVAADAGAEATTILVSQSGLSSRPLGDMPAYDGLIKLRNPGDAKLFFNASEPVRLEALIPPGFRDGKPELEWEISRYVADGTSGPMTDGKFSPAANGKASDFAPADDALMAGLGPAKLERGVYVLTSRLRVNGQVVEEREPEPLLVTGKVKLPASAGDTLEQGLALTLEQTIDFTDPKDPHPCFETDAQGPTPSGTEWGSNYYHTAANPLIVERGGLKYRATRPVYQAQFSYRVDFTHPGDWYLLVLEYPDDAERWIGVSCSAGSRMNKPEKGKETADASSKCGPIVWTGGKYPNTGKMLEMKWIYRPDPGSHAINVMSLMNNTDAAAARLRIHHIAGRLPELDAGPIPVAKQRRFGMLTERTCPYQSGIYNLFSSFDELPSSHRGNTGAGQRSGNAVLEACERLRVMEDAALHYAEYLRFAGQNLHTMGCYQYHDRNTAPQYLTGDPRLHYNPYDVLARALQANGLLFYASVEFMNTYRRQSGAEQKPEWYLGSRAGQSGPANIRGAGAGGLNFMHPDIEKDMLAVARQLAEEFKAQPNFLGINWTAYFGGSWLPSYRLSSKNPLDFGYDDFTVGLFEKESGVKIPVDAGAPDRFEKRYQFLTSAEMQPRWLAWRAQKMVQFFEKVNRVIREVRPDLETVAGCYLAADHIAEWKHQGAAFRDYLDSWGWNPELFQAQPGLWLMPWLQANARYRPAFRSADYAMAWQGNHDLEFYRPFAGLDKRALMLCVGWHEVEAVAAHFPFRPGWPRPYQQTMMGQQREELALEPYSQALIGFDPQMVMMGFTDVSPYIGVEDAQRKFARVLRRLPWGRFEPVLGTGFDSNFAIRALRAGDQYHFYVVNPGYWPIQGTVKLEGAKRVADLVSSKEVPLANGSIAVALDPFGITAFTAEGSSNIEISSWSTVPPAAANLAHLQGILDQAKAAAAKPDVAGFLGSADYGVLTGTLAKAEQALAEKRQAAAWDAATDAFFWTILFQKIPEMQFAELVKPRAMTSVRWGSGLAPKIDGLLNDRAWEEPHSKPVNYFVTKDKTYAELKTFVRLVRTRDRLFIAFACRDPEPDKIRGTAPPDDKRQFWGARDDTVALLIMPDGTNYYQFAVSAGGAKFDQRCRTDGFRDYEYAPKWQAAVNRNREGWTVEIELDPADAFGKPIANGTEWKINFHRAVRLNEQPYSSWVYSPDWHSMEHMGVIRFEEAGR